MIVIRVFGFIILIIGLLFCLTIIGAVLGIPMMIVGSIMVAISFFGRQKTTITNVVQVAGGSYQEAPTPPTHPVQSATRASQQVSTGKFCSECGAAVKEESAFCEQCGVKL
jgi:hypothetical protein